MTDWSKNLFESIGYVDSGSCAVVDRLLIGRRVRNDAEQLEKLFELYTKTTTSKTSKEGRSA